MSFLLTEVGDWCTHSFFSDTGVFRVVMGHGHGVASCNLVSFGVHISCLISSHP